MLCLSTLKAVPELITFFAESLRNKYLDEFKKYFFNNVLKTCYYRDAIILLLLDEFNAFGVKLSMIFLCHFGSKINVLNVKTNPAVFFTLYQRRIQGSVKCL